MAKGNVIGLWFALATAFCWLETVLADLPFTTSYARQCTPLNVTWTPNANGYPYSVYILGVGTSVQSYKVNSDYQPNAQQITFQYSVPKPSPTFQSFIVAVADSQGNGNSSSIMIVDTNGPDDCNVYAQTSAFIYASDSTSGQSSDRLQCGSLRYYPVNPPFRGTSPFSFTYVPIQGKPITVNIPQRATFNSSYFIYDSVLPLSGGTQFYQFMSDATGGGSGGGSPIYTVGTTSNSSCLASSYQLANVDTNNALPEGAQTATFQNLAGAVDAASGSSSGGSSTGGLIGGIIGAVIGVGGILVIIGAYLIYRKRQKRKRELERKEQPQFVDLDDDDLGDATTAAAAARRRNPNDGVRQSYSVSPFTYEPTTHTSQPDTNNGSSELMLLRSGNVNGIDEVATSGAAYSPNGLRPTSTTTSEFNASAYPSHQSVYDQREAYAELARLTAGAHRSVSPPQPSVSRQQSAVAGSIGARTMSGGGDDYESEMWRTPITNRTQSPGSMGRTNNYPSMSAESYPMSSPLTSTGGAHAQFPTGATTHYAHPSHSYARPGMGMEPESRSSTYLQHQDAGPVRPHDVMEEMPPSYGQWITPPTASSSNKNESQNDSKREGGGAGGGGTG